MVPLYILYRWCCFSKKFGIENANGRIYPEHILKKTGRGLSKKELMSVMLTVN